MILQFKEDPYKETIELVKLLGLGCYGEVWKGKEKSSGREVAVKLETPTLGVSFSNGFFLKQIQNKKLLFSRLCTVRFKPQSEQIVHYMCLHEKDHSRSDLCKIGARTHKINCFRAVYYLENICFLL